MASDFKEIAALNESTKDQLSNLGGFYRAVTDTSIADHANPATVGSIAKALADCAAAGGGRVSVGPGTFNLTSAALIVGRFVALIGAGKRTTYLIQAHATADCILMDGGVDQGVAGIEVSDFDITVPIIGTPGACLNVREAYCSYSAYRNLTTHGGAGGSWSVLHSGNNVLSADSIEIRANANGFKISSTGVPSVNWGDSTISDLDVALLSPNTVGVELSGVSGAGINNYLFSRIEITGGNFSGNVGLNLAGYAIRNSFVHMDFENLASDIEISSTSLDNTFFGLVRPSTFGAITTDYTNFDGQRFLGGNAAYYRSIETYISTMQKTVILTADTVLTKFLHGGRTILNSNSIGPVSHTLPDAGSVAQANSSISFYTDVAQPVTITAGVGDGIRDTDLGAVASVSSPGTTENFITLKSVSFNRWIVTEKYGTWT